MPGLTRKYGYFHDARGSGQEKKREVLGGNKPMQPKFLKEFDQVFQLKIEVKNSNPPIWRRIEVPDTFDFSDLHHAIQDAMHGWLDCHNYNYAFPSGAIIDDSENFVDQDELAVGLQNRFEAMGLVWRPNIPTVRQRCFPKVGTKLNAHFSEVGTFCIYLYDFGDDWEHRVTLEGISPKVEGMIYPRILDGERACPIEGAGGLAAYMGKLEILADPDDIEYDDTVEWAHRFTGIQRDGQDEFKPEYFNKEKVTFTLTSQ